MYIKITELDKRVHLIESVYGRANRKCNIPFIFFSYCLILKSDLNVVYIHSYLNRSSTLCCLCRVRVTSSKLLNNMNDRGTKYEDIEKRVCTT